MHPANERWCCTVAPFLIGRAHTQNDSMVKSSTIQLRAISDTTHNLSITEHYIAKITTTYPGCSELIMQDCWICSAIILSRMLMHWIQQFHTILNHDDIMTWKHFPYYWPLGGNLPVTRGRPHQRPVMRSFGVVFVASLNKLLDKQSSHWWLEWQWPWCDVTIITH